jgi:hypothetical protein
MPLRPERRLEYILKAKCPSQQRTGGTIVEEPKPAIPQSHVYTLELRINVKQINVP